MKPEKAIELLNHLPLPIKTTEDHDRHLAVSLGIEALKRLRDFRIVWSKAILCKLPGETEE